MEIPFQASAGFGEIFALQPYRIPIPFSDHGGYRFAHLFYNHTECNGEKFRFIVVKSGKQKQHMAMTEC